MLYVICINISHMKMRAWPHITRIYYIYSRTPGVHEGDSTTSLTSRLNPPYCTGSDRAGLTGQLCHKSHCQCQSIILISRLFVNTAVIWVTDDSPGLIYNILEVLN